MMLGLTSCNPGIFIEHLEASEAEYVLPFTGGSAGIVLSHGDWEIERVAVDKIDGDISDEGAYESRFLSFRLTRPSETKICLELEHSTDPDPVLIDIHISNEFQSLCIPVRIEACCGYSFERIEYGIVTERNEGFEEVQNERFGRKICFPAASVTSEDMPEAAWMEELLKYVGGTFNIPLPVPFPERGTVPECKEFTEFSYKETFTPMESPSAPEDENTTGMYWGYVEYRVPYTIWFTHPEGRTLSLSGEFTSKTHDGRWRTEP